MLIDFSDIFNEKKQWIYKLFKSRSTNTQNKGLLLILRVKTI